MGRKKQCSISTPIGSAGDWSLVNKFIGQCFWQILWHVLYWIIWLKWYSSLSQLIGLLWWLAHPFQRRKERFLWNLSNNHFKKKIFSFKSLNHQTVETVRKAIPGKFSVRTKSLRSVEVILFLPHLFVFFSFSNKLEKIKPAAWFNSQHALGISAKWEKRNFPLRRPPSASRSGVHLKRPAVGWGQAAIFKQQESSRPVRG